jgi:Tfp pilus assembly protein PilW
MTGTAQKPFEDDRRELPRPRRGSRWRWSRPRQALVAGGTLAAALGLGVATGAGAAPTSGTTGAAAHGRPPGGVARPTVAGKVTALRGDDITVETHGQASVTVVISSHTAFETDPGPNGGTTTSAAALKVGDFVGVQGTNNSDGTVTAATVVMGRPSGAARGGAPPTAAPSA